MFTSLGRFRSAAAAAPYINGFLRKITLTGANAFCERAYGGLLKDRLLHSAIVQPKR